MFAATEELLVVAGGGSSSHARARARALSAGSMESQPWAGRAVPGGWVLNKLQLDFGCCHRLESRISKASELAQNHSRPSS